MFPKRRELRYAYAEAVEIEQLELFPGKGFVEVNMTGDFMFDADNGWTVERLHMLSSAYLGLWPDADGNMSPAWAEYWVRIDDDPEFRVFVRAANAWADKNLDEAEYEE